MTEREGSQPHEEFDSQERRLRGDRAQLEPIRLDAIRRHVFGRAGGRHSSRVRLVVALSTIGLMGVGAGGVVAAGGTGGASSARVNAAVAQYSSPTPAPTPPLTPNVTGPPLSPTPPPGSGVAASPPTVACTAKAVTVKVTKNSKSSYVAVVTGGGIKKVVVKLDGKPVKTSHKGGKYTINVNPSKTSFGKHTVTVHVTNNCGTVKSHTLHVTRVQPKRAVAPTFTG